MRETRARRKTERTTIVRRQQHLRPFGCSPFSKRHVREPWTDGRNTQREAEVGECNARVYGIVEIDEVPGDESSARSGLERG